MRTRQRRQSEATVASAQHNWALIWFRLPPSATSTRGAASEPFNQVRGQQQPEITQYRWSGPSDKT